MWREDADKDDADGDDGTLLEAVKTIQFRLGLDDECVY